MTRTLAAAIVLILTVATLFVPLAAFAFSSDKKDVTTIAPHNKSIAKTDLKVPANASDHPGISVISLAGQSNNNNQLAACTSKPSQERGTAPPFCNGHLVVVKHVINDDGGTSSAGDFTISVSRSSPGEESPGNSVALSPGSYSVSETGPAGYTQSLSGDCSGTINAGDNRVCTITNNDNPQTAAPSITVTSVRCTGTPEQPRIDLDVTVSGISHDSHSIIFQEQVFSPTGYLVRLQEYTIQADAPDSYSLAKVFFYHRDQLREHIRSLTS